MRPQRKPTPEPDAAQQHDLRRLIKSCIRSRHPFTENERWVLGDLLRVVNKFGRLPRCQHALLMVLSKKCGVQ